MIPYFRQETDAYCAPAVLQMIFACDGVTFTQAELAVALKTDPTTGTALGAMAALLAEHGYHTERKNGATTEDIKEALAQDKLVVVGYIETGGEPHYALVSALSDTHIYLADTLMGHDYSLPLGEFLDRWRDNEHQRYGERAMLAISSPQHGAKK